VDELGARVGRLLGARPTRWQPRAAPWQPSHTVAGGNNRFTVELADGRRVFVKAATSPYLAGALRREAEVYANLRTDFAPELICFDDDPDVPMLVLEDLSDADWSVHWDAARVAAVRDTLRAVAATLAPPNTPPATEGFSNFGDWADLIADPAAFVATGIRSPEWLDRNASTLQAAAKAAPIDGDALLHLDVRSDNLCFRDGKAILVDWNWACTGKEELDVAAWLPSLAAEGGPRPWEILPRAGGYASLLAGVWAAVVGLPPPATAPHVRDLQRRQLEVALVWAERELNLH
jgi:thiamine kinase-like enzyme